LAGKRSLFFYISSNYIYIKEIFILNVNVIEIQNIENQMVDK